MMMKTIKLILFCVTLIALASIALAQDARQAAFAKRAFNHASKITTEYKAEENTSYFFLEPVFIDYSETAKTSLRLAANFQYEGKTPDKPKSSSGNTPQCSIYGCSSTT